MSIFDYIQSQKFGYSHNFHMEVASKLSSLLSFSCNIPENQLESNSDFIFEYNVNSSSTKRLIYNFLYNTSICYVDISIDDKSKHFDKSSNKLKSIYYSTIPIEYQRLLVTFKFPLSNFPKSMPIGANSVSITVDCNMDFMSARFENRFDFGFGLPNSSSIIVYKLMNDLGDTKKIIEYFNPMLKTTSLNSNSISHLYLDDNIDFEKSFLKMMLFLRDKPDLFSSVFTDYPTYIYLVDNEIDGFKELFTKFSSDYVNDPLSLESKFLLLEMQLI